MKKVIYVLILLLLLSCQEYVPVLSEEASISNTSRASANQSVYFDWESQPNSQILINGQQVKLPWYPGAMTQIPNFILEDYKKEDGWEMIYNFCTAHNEEHLNTLFFYNKFTSKLRVFYYNENPVTSGTTTFAQLTLLQNSKILNFSSDKSDLALDTNGPTSVVTSNITSTEARSIGYGWNCFEVELAYDPFVPQNRQTMSFAFFDKHISSIQMNGTAYATSKATFITTENSNPFNDAIKGISNASGSAAEGLINDLFESSTEETRAINFIPILGAAVKGLATLGVNALLKASTNRFNKQTQKITTIDIKTEGNFNIDGTITGTQSAVIPPIAGLLYPGVSENNRISQDIYPVYDVNLGVWNVRSTPIVKIYDRYRPFMYRVSPEEVLGYDPGDDQNIYFYIFNELRMTPYYLTKNDIEINPNTLSEISDYEVKTEYIIKDNSGALATFLSDNRNYYTQTPWFTINEDNRDKYLYKNFPINKFKYAHYAANDGFLERNDYVSDIFFDGTIELLAKVTLTLYPKPPYKGDGVMMTRTFKCNIEKLVSPDEYTRVYQ